MEFKFNGRKKPLLKNVMKYFFEQMDLTDIDLRVLFYGRKFSFVLEIDYFNLDNADNFLRDNDKLKVMSIEVEDNKYTINCF